MTLTPNDYTKAMWDKDFKVTQTITLGGGELKATMKVKLKILASFFQVATKLESVYGVRLPPQASSVGGGVR